MLDGAGLDTVTPGILIIQISGISALFEPSTAGSTTTGFARFVESTALVAYVSDGRSCGSWASVHMRYMINGSEIVEPLRFKNIKSWALTTR